jgi:hypothetical protein
MRGIGSSGASTIAASSAGSRACAIVARVRVRVRFAFRVLLAFGFAAAFGLVRRAITQLYTNELGQIAAPRPVGLGQIARR